MLLKIFLACLVQALAFISTYISSEQAFSDTDVWGIALFGAAGNALLLPVVLSLSRFRFIANVTLSIIVMSGVIPALAIHTWIFREYFTALILLCATAGVALFAAFRIIDETRWGGVTIVGIILLSSCIIVGRHLQKGEGHVGANVAHLRKISFQERPNVYFVSFDGLAPRALLEKYMKLSTTDLLDKLEKRFRRFPNFFSNAIHTIQSINLVLALDPSVYTIEKMRDNINPFFFTGQNPSPLFAIFRKNGYETTSIYSDALFGKKKGPYVDNFFYFRKGTVCNLLDPQIRNISFWMYCSPLLDTTYGYHGRLGNLATVERITRVDTDGAPQFVFAHIYPPGHVHGSFRYEEPTSLEKFKVEYLRQSQRASWYLEMIIRHLEEEDPDAILFVYGDHGPLLSHRSPFVDNREFVIQDHYGVWGGIYPPDACAAWFDDASAKGYMTILDAVHTILRCLSDGETVYHSDALPEYKIANWKRLFPDSEGLLDYKEFLYE